MILFEPGSSCEICGKEHQPLSKCRLCGAFVCQECLCSSEEICLVCRDARCYICREYLAARACDRCGQPVCEDHGTRVGEATICDNCIVGREK